MTQAELVNNIYSKNFGLIQERISKSNYPTAFKMLLSSSRKMGTLLDSMIYISSSKNFYSSQIMTRIVIEHFIVAYYVWTRTRIEKSDLCAEEYYGYYGLQEQIKQENYNAKLDKTYDAGISPLQNFLKKASDFSDMTEENLIEINTVANKFDIKKVLLYMTDDLNNDDPFKPIHKIVLNLCKVYNYLSSYVHGGPSSELQTFENIPKTNHEKLLKENLDKCEMMDFQIKSFIMLLLIFENKDHIDIYQPVLDFLAEQKNNQ